jgi:hypothetical protein
VMSSEDTSGSPKQNIAMLATPSISWFCRTPTSGLGCAVDQQHQRRWMSAGMFLHLARTADGRASTTPRRLVYVGETYGGARDFYLKRACRPAPDNPLSSPLLAARPGRSASCRRCPRFPTHRI